MMQGITLYAEHFAHSVTAERLRELSSSHGEVKEVRIFSARGFGFVEMSDSSEAETTKEALNDSDFEGHTLRVEEARPSRSQQRGFYKSNGYRR